MCAGWDGCEVENPGFPKDGKWNVMWEGLSPMPYIDLIRWRIIFMC